MPIPRKGQQPQLDKSEWKSPHPAPILLDLAIRHPFAYLALYWEYGGNGKYWEIDENTEKYTTNIQENLRKYMDIYGNT